MEKNTNGIPTHISIIMDGNGRWAKKNGLERFEGHKKGTDSVRKSIEACLEIGVKYLTLYAFSKENWNRPEQEVKLLMGLLVKSIEKEKDELIKNGVRVRFIGNLRDLPKEVLDTVQKITRESEAHTSLNLNIALSYGGKWEIVNAVRKIAMDFKSGYISDINDIDEMFFEKYLTTYGLPNPDLMIRTGGEYRISNFLIWQSAYTELYFIDKYWPEFEKEDLSLAVSSFMSRERRFGMTGEQIKK